jgi:hypothetical protein
MLCVRFAKYNSGFQLLIMGSDKNWNTNNSGLTTPQPYGVPLSGTPRTMNGYLTRMNQNGGLNCIKLCLTQNRNFTFAATNDNQCCESALSRFRATLQMFTNAMHRV